MFTRTTKLFPKNSRPVYEEKKKPNLKIWCPGRGRKEPDRMTSHVEAKLTGKAALLGASSLRPLRRKSQSPSYLVHLHFYYCARKTLGACFKSCLLHHVICYELSCASMPWKKKETYWSTNSECLTIWPYFKRAIAAVWFKLRWGHTGVGWTPNPIWWVSVRQLCEDSETHKENTMLTMKAKVGVTHLEAKECHRLSTNH